MNIYNIISNQPKCRTCNKLMKEWNPFSESHEHLECTSNRISDHLINIIKESFGREKRRERKDNSY